MGSMIGIDRYLVSVENAVRPLLEGPHVWDVLVRLLERTTLSALIKASTAVADRIDFLTALEHLVFAPETKPRVKECDELHRILEDSCWVFGEEYALHVSDRSPPRSTRPALPAARP
ncbi:hypothetical protein ACFUZA_18400 [Streptomyces cellulosae]|uniref:hypothetical protein n=1 Tax=Streptomyces cellulosae TaxID=1968 RepID=UPI003687B2DF